MSKQLHSSTGPNWWLRRAREALVVGAILLTLGAASWLGYAKWVLLTDEKIARLMSFGEVLAGVLALLGLTMLSWRTWVADRQARTAARQADLVERGQVTERFTRAVEQLGSYQRPVRIGAIYSLERIAKDSAGDRSTVAEVLCAFVRDWRSIRDYPPGTEPKLRRRETEQEPIPADVLAALQVLAAAHERGSCLHECKRDLRGADFSNRGLSGACLAGLDLESSDFSGADLSGVDLSGANLSRAKLEDAYLWRASLRGADLCSAMLIRASVNDADLTRACLVEADLFAACLIDTDLRLADLREAHLFASDIAGARLEGADLAGAYWARDQYDPADDLLEEIFGESLAAASDVDFDSALGDSTTILPDGAEPPMHWPVEQ